MSPVPFAMVGGGWRAEFFARVAALLPDRFRMSAAVLRDPDKGAVWGKRWNVPVHGSIADLDPKAIAFVVVSVAQPAAPDLVAEAHAHGLPVLVETPPAPDLDGLLHLWSLVEAGAVIEVAEQYPLQPHHAARLALCRSGRLGPIRFAHVSEAHDYHAIALLRAYLGAGFDDATITAQRFTTSVVAGPGRAGPPDGEDVIEAGRTIAHLDWRDRRGVYDFCGEQYFSWIRARFTIAQGERGELRDNEARFLLDARTPMRATLRRDDAGLEGNLEGLWHRGYAAGGEWVYTNPFPGVALADDEIAVAGCLARTARRAETGEPGYDFTEAAQDQYLASCIAQALADGAPVTTTAQPWAKGG